MKTHYVLLAHLWKWWGRSHQGVEDCFVVAALPTLQNEPNFRALEGGWSEGIHRSRNGTGNFGCHCIAACVYSCADSVNLNTNDMYLSTNDQNTLNDETESHT